MSRESDTLNITNENGLTFGKAVKTCLVATSTITDKTISLPDISDTLITKSTVDMFSNKILDTKTCSFKNGSTGGQLRFNTNAVNNGNSVTIQFLNSNSGIISVPNFGILSTTDGIEVLSNKTVDDDSFFIQEVATGAQMRFDVDSVSAGNTLTVATVGTGTNKLELPNTNDRLITRNTIDEITNKTITSNTNDVYAKGLFINNSADVIIVAGSGIAAAGQMLITTSPNTATWQTYTLPGSSSGTVTTNNTTSPVLIQTISTLNNTFYHLQSTIIAKKINTESDLTIETASFTLSCDYIRSEGTSSLSKINTADTITTNIKNSWNIYTEVNIITGNIEIYVIGALLEKISWKSSSMIYYLT